MLKKREDKKSYSIDNVNLIYNPNDPDEFSDYFPDEYVINDDQANYDDFNGEEEAMETDDKKSLKTCTLYTFVAG